MRVTVGKMARLSATYVFGDMITRGAALLLLPLYTSHLSPGEYGAIAVLEMIRQVLVVLVSFGLAGGVMRLYYSVADDDRRRRLYGALWGFLIVVPGLPLLALGLAAAALETSPFSQIPFDPYLRLTLWLAWLSVGFALLPPALFRAREQARSYVAFSLAGFAATAAGVVVFVVVLDMGVLGYLYGQLAGAVASALLGSALLLRELRPNLCWGGLGPALAFSLPLMPHFLAHWVLGVSDRAILERHVPLEALGVYALAYQLGLAYYMLITAANNALFPAFGRAGADPTARAELPRLSTYYVLAIAASGTAIGLAGGDVLRLLTPPAYHEAAAVAPLIILGYGLMGLYQIPMSATTLVGGKSWAVPLVTAAAAAANVLLNLLTVPRFGIYAAAVNTVVGYALLAAGMFLLAHYQQPLPYEYGRAARALVACGLLIAAGAALAPLPPLLGLAGDALLLLALPLALTAVGFWNEAERRELRAFGRRLAPGRARAE